MPFCGPKRLPVHKFNAPIFSNPQGLLAISLHFHTGVQGVRLYDGPDIKTFVGWSRTFLSVAWSTAGGSAGIFLLLRVSVSYSAPRDLHRQAAH